MSKTKTSTPTEITDEETNKIDSNAAAPEEDSGKSNAAGKDPGDVPMHDEEDSADNILTPQEKANNEFLKNMTDFTDEVDDEDFVEGAKAPAVKKPADGTPAGGEVVQAAGKTPAQSELEASNVAKGLNPDGTAKEPTPQAPIPPTTPELNADGTPKAAAPVQQVQPQTPQEPTPAGEVAPTPEQMAEYYQNWRTQTEDALAKTHYKISQETMDELDTQPDIALPKLMAKVYLDAITATLAQVNANFPRMVNEVLTQQKVGNEREEQFYQAWPDLKGEAATVIRIAGAYRQMNPNATTDDFIREVGAQAMVTLRKPIPGMAAQPQVQVPAKPFKPAASTPPSSNGAPPPKNPFEQLNDAFDEDFDTD